MKNSAGILVLVALLSICAARADQQLKDDAKDVFQDTKVFVKDLFHKTKKKTKKVLKKVEKKLDDDGDGGSEGDSADAPPKKK